MPWMYPEMPSRQVQEIFWGAGRSCASFLHLRKPPWHFWNAFPVCQQQSPRIPLSAEFSIIGGSGTDPHRYCGSTRGPQNLDALKGQVHRPGPQPPWFTVTYTTCFSIFHPCSLPGTQSMNHHPEIRSVQLSSVSMVSYFVTYNMLEHWQLNKCTSFF